MTKSLVFDANKLLVLELTVKFIARHKLI